MEMSLKTHERSSIDRYLRHHSSPCDNICRKQSTRIRFIVGQSFEQTVQVVVCGVVQLLKSIEPLGQICPKCGGVIVSKRTIIKMETVLFIVGKVGYLLDCMDQLAQNAKRRRAPRLTLGLLIAALFPAYCSIGCMEKWFIAIALPRNVPTKRSFVIQEFQKPMGKQYLLLRKQSY